MSGAPSSPRALTVLLALLCGLVVASSIVATAMLHSPFPHLDEWAVVGDIEAMERGEAFVPRLFAMHNEHWIVVPRVLLWLDAVLTRCGGELAIALTFAVQGLHAMLLLRLGRRAAEDGAPLPAACTAAVVAATFAAAQIENFVEPFQVQFVLVYLVATAGAAALARAAESPRRPRWVIAAILAGIVATATMSNGVLVWPCLLALAWWLRLGNRALAGIGGAAAITLAAFAAHYRRPEYLPDPLAALRMPGELSLYWLRAIGGAGRWIDAAPRGGLAIACGAGILLALLLAAPPIDRQRRGPSARAALVASGAFVLLSFLAIATGRVQLGAGTALAGRYGTPSLLLAAVAALSLAAHRDRRHRLAVPTAMTILAIVAAQQCARIAGAARSLDDRQPAIDACLCSVRDQSTIVPWTGDFTSMGIDRAVPFLRQRRWSVWASARDLLLDRPLHEVLDGALPLQCPGAIDAVEVVRDTGWGVRVRGTARLPATAAMPRNGLVVDDRDRVVGLCAVRPGGDDHVEFTGSASVAAADSELRVVLGDGMERFEVAGRGRARDVAIATSNGAPLGAAAAIDGGFTVHDESPRSESLPRPPAGRSAICNVVSTGTATLGPLPEVTGFVLPIATGPMTFGVGVRVLDTTTGEIVTELRPAPTFGTWRLWRFEIPPERRGHRLTLIAADLGWRDGQWLAIGEPLALHP